MLPPLHVPLAQSTLTSHGSPDGDAHAPLAPQAPLAQSPGRSTSRTAGGAAIGDAGGVLRPHESPAANLQIFLACLHTIESACGVGGSDCGSAKARTRRRRRKWPRTRSG